MQQLFYSEILDHWMAIIVTSRALQLIEQCGGLDPYILSVSIDGKQNGYLLYWCFLISSVT